MSNPILQAAVRAILIDSLRDNIRISGLHIDGVEVTQAIEDRSADQHLTDSADRGPDNSIRLVADKAARYGCTFAIYRRRCSASSVRSRCSGDVTACGWTLTRSPSSGRQRYGGTGTELRC